MHKSNESYVYAFPTAQRGDVLAALAVLPENPRVFGTFSVRIGGEAVMLPERIYHPKIAVTDKLTPLQQELIHCLMTRHHDGFVRQESLARIIGSRRPWACPFVIKLIGEYVSLKYFRSFSKISGVSDTSMYRHFLTENPEFLAITGQRVVSYSDCSGDHRRGEYVGFQVLEYLEYHCRISDPAALKLHQ